MVLDEGEGATQDQTEIRLQRILQTIQEAPSGKVLIQQVAQAWKLKSPVEIANSLKWGDVSRTDTILTRHFNPKTGSEDRERQIVIYLRRDQSDLELALDLAHELVHAGARPSFDPYDPTLTAGKYIWAALEGEGGEVEAVRTECTIGFELAARLKTSFVRCQGYAKPSQGALLGAVEKEKVRQDFYRVGKWYSELKKSLGDEAVLFPLLSQESPKLYSSTGHAPYPAALLKEFQEITETACHNSRQRMRSMASQESRSPFPQSGGASTGDAKSKDAPQDLSQGVQKFLQNRCK
jgi:hypothetical protein